MLDVEQAIHEVGTVYQALTGQRIEIGRSELPSDIDARAYLENRYRQFKSILESPQKAGAPALDPTWSPALSVVELPQEIRFEIDLPGVARDQVSVATLGDWLLVRGRRGGEPTPGAAVRYTERGNGSFQRVLAIPPRARRDGVKASLAAGVLTIVVPTDGPGGGAAQPIEIT